MLSVFDVAKYILGKRGRMSTWKLQKLCYYCQAWHYTWTERQLFAEEIQAWRNGPVCPALFYEHQGRFMISAEDLKVGNSSKINADESESIDTVLDEYGKLEPYYLSELTHQELPWKNARDDLPEDAISDKAITLESMGAYYGSLI